MEIRIRNYKTADFNQLINLLKEARLYQRTIDKKDILKRKICHDPDSIIVAEKGIEIIGCVFYIYDPWVSLIYHLVVNKRYRNMGIGTRLMVEVERKLGKRRVVALALYLHERDKKVIKFYERIKWFKVGKVICMGKIKK